MYLMSKLNMLSEFLVDIWKNKDDDEGKVIVRLRFCGHSHQMS